MTNPIDAIVKQASRLPATGLAENYRQRIGSGNPKRKFCSSILLARWILLAVISRSEN